MGQKFFTIGITPTLDNDTEELHFVNRPTKGDVQAAINAIWKLRNDHCKYKRFVLTAVLEACEFPDVTMDGGNRTCKLGSISFKTDEIINN